MSKVDFGRGIIDMVEAQCKELRRIYEKLVVRKLDLGRNFTRKLLCGRVMEIDTGSNSPKIAIASQKIKLYLYHMRMGSKNEK